MTGPVSAGAAMVLVAAFAGWMLNDGAGAAVGAVLAFMFACMVDE